MEALPDNHPGKLLFEILESPEFALREKLHSFRSSIYILDVNYKELASFLESLVDPGNPHAPAPFTNPEKIPDARREVSRRLHNFVAAVLSLVDHSRVLYRDLYEPGNRLPEYPERVKKEFAEDALVRFVQSLRQYTQHYELPVIGFSQELRQSEAGFTEHRAIYLNTADLLKFNNWSSQAKKYLRSLEGKNIDILEVATAYRNKVTSFYKWFLSEQEQIHRDELKRLEDREANFRTLHEASLRP